MIDGGVSFGGIINVAFIEKGTVRQSSRLETDAAGLK